MPRQGEFTYFSRIGESGRQHSLQKPYLGHECPLVFADLSFIFAKLPPPPARILECGCGTGWLTYMLAKRGYEVVGQDVSEEALELARGYSIFRENGPVDFICSDFEGLDLKEEFDAVIFYSSLHHAQDELGAIRSAYNALKPGGIFLSVEPGRGHEKASRQVIEDYDLGDRDMPPTLQIRRGREVGFREFKVFVHPAHLHKLSYGPAEPPASPLKRMLLKVPGGRFLVFILLWLWYKKHNGAVLMRK